MARVSARLAALVDAAVTELTAGTNLFSDWFPDQPDVCVGLMESAGVPQHYAFQGEPSAGGTRVQVKVRAGRQDALAAELLAWRVHRALWDMLDVAPSAATEPRILVVMTTADPVMLERDDQERVVYVCNYDVLASPSEQ